METNTEPFAVSARSAVNQQPLRISKYTRFGEKQFLIKKYLSIAPLLVYNR